MKTPTTKKQNVQVGIEERIEYILKYLNSGLFEKEAAIRLSLLALIAGESLFFIGPPGTAKSMIARRMQKVFKENNTMNYFEYLLNEFSTPDEIFGPVSLKELEQDNYKRIINGYMPNANIVFLDEIWKAGPAILNTLLTIINEKKFHNGNTIEEVPLLALLAASNELPENDRGLEALWDRFIIRVKVDTIENEDSFIKMISESQNNDIFPSEKIKQYLITKKELQYFQQEIEKVQIPNTVKQLIIAIKKELININNQKKSTKEEKYYISDRRWKKIIHILRTSAFLNGRDSVDLMDVSLIRYCIWGTNKQIETSKQIVTKFIQEYGLECVTAIDDINEQIEEFKDNINNTWYVKEIITGKEPEPIIKELRDDYQEKEECYQVKDNLNKIYYIAVNKNSRRSDRWTDYYNLYDENQKYEDYVQIEKKTPKTLSIDSKKYSIQFTPEKKSQEKTIKNKVIFNNTEVYQATKSKFDNEKYRPIAEYIDEEIKKLNAYKKTMEAPFKNNLFAEQSFSNIILNKIDSAEIQLEDAKISLEKQKARYEK